MNAIRATRALNQRELDNAVAPSASWHADYRDTAYIYVGGLPLDLSEGDITTIFSQFGNPTHLNLVREKETGKSRGFAFLKYEDQRSCDLAVDNLGGAEVLGRVLRVDHSRYKKREGEDEDTWRIERLEVGDGGEEGQGKRGSETEEEGESAEERKRRKRRKVLKEETELEHLLAIKQDGGDEDPMRDYMIREKREDVERARHREKEKEKRHRHRHRHHEDGEDGHGSRRHRVKDESIEDGHKSRRHRDREINEGDDERGPRRRHQDLDNDAHINTSRRDREREARSARDFNNNHSGHQRRRSRSPGYHNTLRREYASSDDERRRSSPRTQGRDRDRDRERRRRGSDD